MGSLGLPCNPITPSVMKLFLSPVGKNRLTSSFRLVVATDTLMVVAMAILMEAATVVEVTRCPILVLV